MREVSTSDQCFFRFAHSSYLLRLIGPNTPSSIKYFNWGNVFTEAANGGIGTGASFYTDEMWPK
jgi:hypothetical protein